MKLREDQEKAVSAVLDEWASGIQRTSVIAPCGWGKTVVMSSLVSRLAREGRRAVIAVNRDELVRQTVDKLKRIDPALTVGIIQAEKNQLRGDVTVASIQTIGRQNRLDKIPSSRFDVFIADEAHYAAAPGWVRAMEHFGCYDQSSGSVALGVTATMTRMPGGNAKPLGEVWQSVAMELDTRWAIENQLLVPVTARTVVIPGLDLKGVHSRGGDFIDGELGKAMAQADAGPLIAKAYSEHCRREDGTLRPAILFAPTVAVAQSFLQDLRAQSICAELVIGETPIHERQKHYAAVREGRCDVLVGVMVMSVGFDLPAVEIAIMARPTKSRGLYIQQVGRALRLSPETGKTSAEILDVVGVSRLGLASIVDLDLEPPKVKDPNEPTEPRGPRRIGDPVDAPQEIGFIAVDPFTGTLSNAKSKKSAWKITKGGRFYLPAARAEQPWLFLHQDEDGTWTLGEMPTRGARKAVRVSSGHTFIEAVAAAKARHPYGGKPAPKLTGYASEGQIRMLNQFGIQYDPDKLDRQIASDLIDMELASRALD